MSALPDDLVGRPIKVTIRKGATWIATVLEIFPVKRQITIRLDSDVVTWFKAHAEGGRGYQTGINRALREHVQRCKSEVSSN